MKPFLSVCMIVKNEEKVLRRSLESIVGLADEIVIADTGSSDSTKKIALGYTEKVFDYKWEDDFSKARNFAASKASGEWILVLDADEYVDRESFISFKRDFKTNPPKENILTVQIVNFVGENAKDTLLNFHERLYKNDGLISYYRSIHELLIHKNSLEIRGVSNLQIYHSGYMKSIVDEKDKSKRNLTLLKNKKDKEPIDYYFIGNEYDQLGDLDRAIKYYQKGFKLKDNIHRDWVKKLLLRLVHALHKARRNSEAFNILDFCEKIFIELVDYKFYKGKIFYELGEINKAETIFEEILLKRDQLKADSSVDFLELLPHKFLGHIKEKNKELHKAVHHYTKALSINDEDEYIWMRLINLLANHSSVEELSDFLNNNLIIRKNMTPLRVIKILHSVPNLNVQKLTRSFLDDPTFSEIDKEALLLKNLQLDGNFKDILKILNKKSSNEIFSLLSRGILNVIDYIIFTIQTGDLNHQKIVREIKFDKSINNLLVMIFNGKRKNLSNFEQEFFSLLFKQAYILQSEEVINILNNIQNYITIEYRNKLNKEMQELKIF